MFNHLYKLLERNSQSIPLEDFTTELFAGTLSNDKSLIYKFCTEFLGLQSNDFRVETQVHYSLEGDNNCVVDVVIYGQNEVCFIENKVNSKEGCNQLSRYTKVLDRFSEDEFVTKLCYCTKKSDPKEINKHSFKQFKWFEVGEFFMKNSKEQITKLFVDFLINKDMSINMTLKGVDLSALENVGNAFKIVNKHIDNCKPQFETIFNDVHDLRQNSHFQKQLNDQNRICVMASPISLSKGWAEVLYGISLDGRLFSHIYFANKNELFDVFLEEIKSQSNLEIAEFDHGATIFKGKNMGDFLNDENSEKKIKDWFCNSFRELSEFMKNSSDNIEWNIKTLPENA